MELLGGQYSGETRVLESRGWEAGRLGRVQAVNGHWEGGSREVGFPGGGDSRVTGAPECGVGGSLVRVPGGST